MRQAHTVFAALACLFVLMGAAHGQSPAPDLSPTAVVPYDGKSPGSAAEVSGSLQVSGGKAIIQSNGQVTAGDHPVLVTLTHRGELRLCATTKVSLTADLKQLGDDKSGLMMALDQGALEASFATGHNPDVILTPDFRITISSPGAAQVQVRLGPKGDTCVDNRGAHAPNVSVSSIFEGGEYRVLPDQRVMFQHGSLREVVDKEKESCGCPPEPAATEPNPFPVAQSAGLAPLSSPPPNATTPGVANAQLTAQLNYNADKPAQAAAPAPPASAAPRRSFFGSLGHFFKKIFGGGN